MRKSIDRFTALPKNVLPKGMANMPDVGRNCAWAEAERSLLMGGFEKVCSTKSYEREWEPDMDPLGDAPPPKNPSKFQHHAIWSHPDGFVIQMDSYQGGFVGGRDSYRRPDAQYDHDMQVLNSLTLSYQIDFGCDLESCMGMMGSGGSRWDRGATMRRHGYGDAVNGGSSLKSMLMDCYFGGKPIALDRWDREFMYVDYRQYSEAPHSSLASESDRFKKTFGARLERDFKKFIMGLPPILGRVMDSNHVIYESKARPERLGPSSEGALAYLATLSMSQGKQWPSDEESNQIANWIESIETSEQMGTPFQPGSLDAAVNGSNILHAIANCSCSEKFQLSVEAWVDSLDPVELKVAIGKRDSLGVTPGQVAAKKSIRSLAGFGKNLGLFAVLADRGLLGDPAEIGAALMCELESQNDRIYSTDLLIQLVDKALAAGARDGVSYLAHMGTDGVWCDQAGALSRFKGACARNGASEKLWSQFEAWELHEAAGVGATNGDAGKLRL